MGWSELRCYVSIARTYVSGTGEDVSIVNTKSPLLAYSFCEGVGCWSSGGMMRIE